MGKERPLNPKKSDRGGNVLPVLFRCTKYELAQKISRKIENYPKNELKKSEQKNLDSYL